MMPHTSHHGLCTTFRNVGGQSQLDQVNVPILNKEKLSFFHWTEGQSILGPVATNDLILSEKKKLKEEPQ